MCLYFVLPLWLFSRPLWRIILATRMPGKQLPILDINGPASQVSERWKKWKRAFLYYSDGQGLTDANKKKAQLLHFAGFDVQDIFDDLPDPGPVPEEGDDEFQITIRKLDYHFRVEENIPYERHVFRHIAMSEGETADQYMIRLKKQARHCNFGASLEDNLRDQLIEQIKNLDLKKKLLETRNITLEQALDKARAWETANLQAKDMTGNLSQRKSESSVNSVKSKQSKKILCYSCGKEGHMRKDKSCPARGKKCAKCGKYGHFAACCKAKSASGSDNGGERHSRGGQRGNRRRGTANCVREEDASNSEEDEFAFVVTEVENVCATSGEPVVSVSINGIDKDVLIDSGSVSNLISLNEYNQLKAQGLQASLKNCDRKLFAYGGKKLEVVGQFDVELAVHDKKIKSHFVVTSNGRCLLGNVSAKALGILHIGPMTSLETDCNSVYDIEAKLKIEYPRVFSGIGKLNDYQLKLHIDENVKPVAQKPRSIPFVLREKVTAKVNSLIEKDIVERVEGPTSWVSPIVVAPKSGGDIRLCVDMRRANEAIIRERIPMPTVDEVLESLNGSTVFSKLDLRLGFHQIELSESSRDITTFATHDGLFRYKRLLFGVNSAPEKYQQIVRQVLAGIEGVQNIADDLVVHGKGVNDHDRNLENVVRRLQERNLTLNPEKCSFRMSKIVFMGILLSKHGIGPTDERVKAVLEAEAPSSPSEIRSFLGMVGFSARFIPDFATTAEPLRKIARKDTDFVWKEDQQRAFDKLKKDLASAPVLAYFDKHAHTRVIADASPVGLGAVLVQEKDGVSRAVCYASRSLSRVERRYSQTEKEALALVWACERFNLYLVGLESFDLVTDHEPLKVIYSRSSKPSARIERWVLRLQPFNFKVCYVKSRNNIADALSRLTRQMPRKEGEADEEYVRMVATNSVPAALNIKEIERESSEDKELQMVRSCLVSGNWENAPKEYVVVRNELTYIGKVILRGTRIIMPHSLRRRVTDLAHEGHQGIVKTKERLRSKVWWPGMDRDAERKCRECHSCQVVTKHYSLPSVKSTRLPDKPWQDLALDLLGPMPTGEHLVVLTDYFSRWVEVDIVRSTLSKDIIKHLDAQFARHGIPRSLRTDNGPNLVSNEMESYLKEMGITHKLTTPLWPRANGEVERQNRSLLKAMRAFHVEKKDWKTELNKYLLAYRSTPHSVTGKSPSQLLYNRGMSCKLPDIVELDDEEKDHQDIRDRDAEKKQAIADYADMKNRPSQIKELQTGDFVLLEKKKENKLSPAYEDNPYQITARHGDQLHLQSPRGVTYKRNIGHVKKYNKPDQAPMAEPSMDKPEDPQASKESSSKSRNSSQEIANEKPSVDGNATPTVRRSGRETKTPGHFKDFIMN